MPVTDSRNLEYDFSMQTVGAACKYDVRWLGIKLSLDTSRPERSVAILMGYVQGALEPKERHLRLMRASVWAGIVTGRISPRFTDFFEDFKFNLSCEYHELARELYPPRPWPQRNRNNTFEATCVWDWNEVRQDLRKLFLNDPMRFIDIRRSIHAPQRNRWKEELQYFTMLCDKETYVR